LSSDEWKTIKVEHGIQEVTITSLLPGSLYEFMVSSRDPHGEGLMSKTIRIHTKGLQISILYFKLDFNTSWLGEKLEVIEEAHQEIQVQTDVEKTGEFHFIFS